MREAEARGGDETARAERQHDRAELVEAAGAQRGGRVQQTTRNALESALQRLHHEGHRVDDRPYHQGAETEGQAFARERFPGAPQRGIRREHQQQVEAEHGGRKNQRQCDQRLDQRGGTAVAPREPPGQGRAQQQQDQRGYRGERDGQVDRIEFGAVQGQGS